LLARRAIDLAVLFLALYAFAFVPLGRRTGLQHVRAILATPAARETTRDVADAVEGLRRRLLDDPAPPTHGAPVVPRLHHHPAPANAAVAPASFDAPDASL
jgi:hypothetical protein